MERFHNLVARLSERHKAALKWFEEKGGPNNLGRGPYPIEVRPGAIGQTNR